MNLKELKLKLGDKINSKANMKSKVFVVVYKLVILLCF